MSQKIANIFVLTRQCIFPSRRKTRRCIKQIDDHLFQTYAKILRNYSRRSFSRQERNGYAVDKWLEFYHVESFVQNEKSRVYRNVLHSPRQSPNNKRIVKIVHQGIA